MSAGEHGRRGPALQRGLGLVELLAGLVMAMLVTIAAFGTVRTFHDAAADIDELARLAQQGGFALQLVGGYLRQAGAIDAERDPATGLYAFRTGDSQSPLAGNAGKDGRPDSLSVVFTAPPAVQPTAADNGDPLPKPAPHYDCSGATLEGGASMRMRFEVDADGHLMCSARNRQPVIDDVAGMRLRYRVETDAGIQTLDALAVERQALWTEVRAVELCLDLASDRRATRSARPYRGCQGEATDPRGRTHLVMRRHFSLRGAGG